MVHDVRGDEINRIKGKKGEDKEGGGGGGGGGDHMNWIPSLRSRK